MIRFYGLLAVLSLLVSQNLFAQDTKTKEELIAAIDKLSKRDVSLVGSIDEEVQEQSAPVVAAGPNQVIVRGMPFGGPQELHGDFEFLVSKDGDLVIATKEELPGVKIFKTGEDVLNVQAHLQEPIGTSKLVSTVSKLVDWVAVANAVQAATEVNTSVKGKDIEVRVVLDNKFIPNEMQVMGQAMRAMPAIQIANAGGGAVQVGNAVRGAAVDVQAGAVLPAAPAVLAPKVIPPAPAVPTVPAAQAIPAAEAAPVAQIAPVANMQFRVGNPMVPTVIELVATFRLNAAKEIIGLVYSLQYNDPIKGFMIQAANNGGVVQIKNKADGEAAELGKLIVYDFDLAEKPSDKLNDFVKQAKTLLKNRK